MTLPFHRLLALLVPLALLLLGSVPAFGTEEGGGHGHDKAAATLVAKVNQVPITLPDLLRKVRALANARNGNKEISAETARLLRKEALEQLVVEELAFQKAKAAGINIQTAEVDNQIAAMKKELGEKHYAMYLESNGLTEETAHQAIERFMAVQKLLDQELAREDFTEAELATAFAERKDQFGIPEHNRVTDVVFFLDPKKKESIQKAAAIAHRLKAEPELDPALLSPDGTFAVQRDLALDPVKYPVLYDQMKSMTVGEVSKPINADGTIHVLMLTAYSPGVEKTLVEIKDQLKNMLLTEYRQQRLEDWKKEIRQNAEIEIFEISAN